MYARTSVGHIDTTSHSSSLPVDADGRRGCRDMQALATASRVGSRPSIPSRLARSANSPTRSSSNSRPFPSTASSATSAVVTVGAGNRSSTPSRRPRRDLVPNDFTSSTSTRRTASERCTTEPARITDKPAPDEPAQQRDPSEPETAHEPHGTDNPTTITNTPRTITTRGYDTPGVPATAIPRLVDRSIIFPRRCQGVALASLSSASPRCPAIVFLLTPRSRPRRPIHNFGDGYRRPARIASSCAASAAKNSPAGGRARDLHLCLCRALRTILRFITQGSTHLWCRSRRSDRFIGNEIAAQIRLRAGKRLAGSHDRRRKPRPDRRLRLTRVVAPPSSSPSTKPRRPDHASSSTLVILKITWDSWAPSAPPRSTSTTSKGPRRPTRPPITDRDEAQKNSSPSPKLR